MQTEKQKGRPKKDKDDKVIPKVFYIDKECVDLINAIDEVGKKLDMKLNVHNIVREFLKATLPLKLQHLKELIDKNGKK